MKKKIASLLIAVVFTACAGDLEVLENDVNFTVEVPDTVYLGEPVCLKSKIDRAFDIRLNLDWDEQEKELGVLKHYCDSLSWTPVAIDTGYHYIQAHVEINPGGELYRILRKEWRIYVMEAEQ